MTPLSLSATIYRYRAETFTQIANQIEADERGNKTDFPVTYWPLIKTLEQWSRPAEHLPEAMLALELAIEDYEAGATDRIPAMMKAVLGWMKAGASRSGVEQEREA